MTAPTRWRTGTASVRGAAHRRNGMPNQDAVRATRCPDHTPLILALADGHGSARCFRSHCGARLAVGVAHLARSQLHEPVGLSQVKRWAEEQLPRELVRQWRRRVERHLAREPFTANELAPLDAAGRRALAANPFLAYGTTLLMVIAAPAFILYLQLGDGDILTVAANGGIERPIAKDPRLIANETTSLCSPQAWEEMRVTFQALAGTPPGLILAATDGYANSFRDEAGFQQVARDLWEMIRSGGWDDIEEQLPDWLQEATEQGSGDDITVGLLAERTDPRRPDAAPRLERDAEPNERATPTETA
ncbi:PP2C family serine/threonine-protein phosphatase [Thioflavicoccus mobilis]|uniref:PP2C family serine/threonine-protein phosphatase n=1 Tax=Thioflavicoccus mobilis TaxID=80679 RepID=UPI0012FA9744|nr:PP2C family serine/threonine-protein phosphatase [Thioflavicoccus mobilis]